MRFFKFLTFALISVDLFAGEFVILTKHGNPILENVQNNTLITEVFDVGKTYTVDTNNFTVNTSTNDDTVIKFSNDLTVKIAENSVYGINQFNQTVINASKYPEKLKYNNSVLTTSLISGQLEIVNDFVNTNVMSYILTTYVTIIPNAGRFIVKADKLSTMVVCIDGSAKIVDNLNRRKGELISPGTMIIIVPQPILSGKAGEMIKRQNIFNTTEIDSGEKVMYAGILKSTDTLHQNSIFITMSGRVHGIIK